MSTKPDVFVFDIDGTLADHQGIRSPYNEALVIHDRPIEPVWKILRALDLAGYKILFLSGRTEDCRTDTQKWLNTQYGGVLYTTLLHMRKRGDNRKDSIIKKEIYDRDILPIYNVIGVFDDRLQVCQMLYENNIFCFNVNQGLKEF
jgi:hydroxymethylpyrimidine pyrophosphatase-like HAD family hydrolase